MKISLNYVRAFAKMMAGGMLMGIYLNPKNEDFAETIRSEIVDKSELITHTN